MYQTLVDVGASMILFQLFHQFLPMQSIVVNMKNPHNSFLMVTIELRGQRLVTKPFRGYLQTKHPFPLLRNWITRMVLAALIQRKHTTLHIREKIIANVHWNILDALTHFVQYISGSLPSTSTIEPDNRVIKLDALRDVRSGLGLHHVVHAPLRGTLEFLCNGTEKLVNQTVSVYHGTYDLAGEFQPVDSFPEGEPIVEADARLAKAGHLETRDDGAADREGLDDFDSSFVGCRLVVDVG